VFDALAFTVARVDEAAPIRKQTAAGLGFLGVGLDEARNAQPIANIDRPSSAKPACQRGGGTTLTVGPAG
jgi:acetate kinase